MTLVTRRPYWAIGLAGGILLALVLATGCDQAPAGPTPVERTVEDLHSQLKTERVRREHDAARHEAELAAGRSDLLGATLIWVSTAIAVVILAFLLARERRARRVLERLIRLLLARIRCSRHPPS